MFDFEIGSIKGAIEDIRLAANGWRTGEDDEEEMIDEKEMSEEERAFWIDSVCPVCGREGSSKQGYICGHCGWEVEAFWVKPWEWTGENPVSLWTYKILYKIYGKKE